MIRTLLIITGASLVLCVAALSGAAAIGGNDLARHGWEWTFHDGDSNQTVTFDRRTEGPAVTRTLDWTGGDRLTITIPADVIYVQGEAASVVVTGPQSRAERVNLVDGRLTWDRDGDTSDVVLGWRRDDRLRVTITAPSVTAFDLESSADLSIRDYDQPTFRLRVSGSGDVDAAGRTGTATVETTGSGDSDLSGLDLADAVVETSGSGDVRIGPSGSARIDISGSGDVDLTRRPANLQQSVSGSGDISQN
jgi:hypothetical protein